MFKLSDQSNQIRLPKILDMKNNQKNQETQLLESVYFSNREQKDFMQMEMLNSITDQPYKLNLKRSTTINDDKDRYRQSNTSRSVQLKRVQVRTPKFKYKNYWANVVHHQSRNSRDKFYGQPLVLKRFDKVKEN